ncbi:hypothetical protein X801_09994, partial [Opisthorchis viverrini]
MMAENSRLRGEKMKLQLQSLKPLKRPPVRRRAPPDGITGDTVTTSDAENIPPPKTSSLWKISQQLSDLQQQIYSVMAHPKVVLLPQPVGAKLTSPSSGAGDSSEQVPSTTAPSSSTPSATSQLLKQTAYLVQLKDELEQLQRKANEAMKVELPQGFIRGDFTSFPSSRLQEILTPAEPSETDKLVSRLILPRHDESSPAVVKLSLSSSQISFDSADHQWRPRAHLQKAECKTQESIWNKIAILSGSSATIKLHTSLKELIRPQIQKTVVAELLCSGEAGQQTETENTYFFEKEAEGVERRFERLEPRQMDPLQATKQLTCKLFKHTSDLDSLLLRVPPNE